MRLASSNLGCHSVPGLEDEEIVALVSFDHGFDKGVNRPRKDLATNVLGAKAVPHLVQGVGYPLSLMRHLLDSRLARDQSV